MRSKFSTLWCKKLKGKEKEDFETYVRNATQIVERLRDIIREREEEIGKSETSDDYESGSWAYKQAHRNGRKEELNALKTLTAHLD